MNLQRAKRLEKKEFIEVELENAAVLKSKTVIISTGARWQHVGVPGVFVAGDCTNTPYKQIIISMGSVTNAALGAFDYLIRN